MSRDRADEVPPGLAADDRAPSSTFSSRRWPTGLPQGVIHADLFPDNVFFLTDRLSGLIDFYFACNDMLAYDLARLPQRLVLRAGRSLQRHQGPGAARRLRARAPAVPAERAALPLLARGAALRFLLTRLYDWLDVRRGALVTPKDPLEYLRKLRFHRARDRRRAIRARSMSADGDRVEIWTDGACTGNPGPGGWGAILRCGEREGAFRRRTADHQQPHGADRGDLGAGGAEAAVRRRAPHRQQYVRNGITGWIHGWKRNGWQTADKKPVKNADLWERLEAAVARTRSTGTGSRATPDVI